MPAKYLFFPKSFCLLLTVGTFTSKIKSYENFSKTVEIKVLHKFLCLLMEGSESAQIITDQDGQKLTDLTDPRNRSGIQVNDTVRYWYGTTVHR